jgi:hypothetical protein
MSPDLVEEDRAAVGELEQALALRLRVGERALLVARRARIRAAIPAAPCT